MKPKAVYRDGVSDGGGACCVGQKVQRMGVPATPPILPPSQQNTPSPWSRLQSGPALAMLKKLVSESDSNFVAVHEEVGCLGYTSHSRTQLYLTQPQLYLTAIPHTASAIPHTASAIPHTASAIPHTAIPHTAIPHTAIPHTAIPHTAVHSYTSYSLSYTSHSYTSHSLTQLYLTQPQLYLTQPRLYLTAIPHTASAIPHTASHSYTSHRIRLFVPLRHLVHLTPGYVE